jgi:hypothetical protein
MNALEIHDVAQAIAEPSARRRYLDKACAGDNGLRQRVEAMLDINGVVEEALPGVERFLQGFSVKKLVALLRTRKPG